MVHVLVKWPDSRLFDVYPLTCVCDAKAERKLSDDVRSVSDLKGELFQIKWHQKKQPSYGYILAAGECATFLENSTTVRYFCLSFRAFCWHVI